MILAGFYGSEALFRHHRDGREGRDRFSTALWQSLIFAIVLLAASSGCEP